MKVCVTKVTDIVGKDKREWTKVFFVTADGTTGDVMYPRGKFVVAPDQFNVDCQTSLEFDQRGRLGHVE